MSQLQSRGIAAAVCLMLGSMAATAHAASSSYTGNTVLSGQGVPLYIVLAPEGQTASAFLSSTEGNRWKTVADTEGAKVVVMDGGTSWDTSADVTALSSLYSSTTSSGIEGASRYVAAYAGAGTTLAAYAAQNPNNLAGVAFINATSTANLTSLTKPQRALAVLTVNSADTGIDSFVTHFRTENARGGTEGQDIADTNNLRYYRTGSSAWNADYTSSHFVHRMSAVPTTANLPNLVYTNLFNKVSRWRTVAGDFTLRAKVRAGMVPGFDKITENDGRNAYVYVPTAVRNNPGVAVPVVMLFHGVTGNGNYFLDQTEWNRVAEQKNFIVYAPTATDFSWSLSTDGPRYRNLINGFGTNGITVNGTKYAVDKRRVYMYGFSNGSVFVSGYSMTYPETIAAAAPWSIADGTGSSTKALPVWYGIGAQDTDYYPNDGGVEYINHMRDLAGSTSSQTINYSAFGLANRIATTVYTGGTVEVRYSLASGIVHGNINEHMSNIWNDFFARYRKKDDGSGLSELIPSGNQAPTANFSFMTNALTANFTDSSTDSDGTIASRLWNFGDGSTSTMTNPMKTYAAAATYPVTLTVTDNGGATNTKAASVTVSATTNAPPVANFTSSVNGATVTFTDTSTDSDGTIASRSWTFGDGTTSTMTSPNKTYAASGTYPVTLTVTDNAGATNTKNGSVTVTVPPSSTALTNGVPVTGITLAAKATKTWTLVVPAGATNLKFVTSGGTGDADLYAKFGSAPTTTVNDCKSEGGTSAETCTITTAQAGTYYVMVLGFDAISNVSLTGSYTTPSGNVAPVANFTSTTSGLTATFTDTSTDSDGTIASRLWDFGDGTTSTMTNPPKTYAVANTYNVKLTVTDNNGATNSKTVAVTVGSTSCGGNVLCSGTAVALPTAATAKVFSSVYTLVVPAGKTSVTFTLSGGTSTSDADLYVNLGSALTTEVNAVVNTATSCVPWTSGSAETCTFTPPTAGGTYYVTVFAYSAYSGVSLKGTISP